MAPGAVRWLVGVSPALLLAACGSGGPASSSAATPAPAPTPRPNIVLVVTDDLDVPTAAVLPQLGLLAKAGVTFTSAFTPAPVCAPSRASILTGLYTHNHNVRLNTAPDGGFPAFRGREGSTLATWLKGAGYRTGLVGKYLNSYAVGASSDGYVPPGWDDWFGRLSAYETIRYFDWWVNDNGRVLQYGEAAEDYSTDVEAKRAVDFVRRAAADARPFFLYVAPEAPHAPALYAERHGAEFRYELAPRAPSFNEDDVADKPAFVRAQPPLDRAQVDALDKLQRFRLRSMRAVEDLLAQLLVALSETGQSDRTWVIFTSDNGLLMGQHRIYAKKGVFYDEAVRVPLLVRGPGVAAPTKRSELVSLVDLAPTILELAGAPAPEALDGRSLAPLLRGQAAPADWRRDVVSEHYNPHLNAALRTDRWSYVEWSSDEYELYDLAADPWELKSLHRTADSAAMAAYAARLRELTACRGTACR